jgi:hypothetical protein
MDNSWSRITSMCFSFLISCYSSILFYSIICKCWASGTYLFITSVAIFTIKTSINHASNCTIVSDLNFSYSFSNLYYFSKNFMPWNTWICCLTKIISWKMAVSVTNSTVKNFKFYLPRCYIGSCNPQWFYIWIRRLDTPSYFFVFVF